MPVAAPGPAARRAGMPAQPDLGPPELLLAGRHYRLVPVDAGDEGSALPAAEVLTARELQIVVLVAEGRVNKQIADALRISEWTVSTHLRRVFAKLQVDTRAAMVSRCYAHVVPLKRES
jgi:DNA-binding CsgD family transcriptional regulator